MKFTVLFLFAFTFTCLAWYSILTKKHLEFVPDNPNQSGLYIQHVFTTNGIDVFWNEPYVPKK